jgi:hypothetical protein
LLVPAGLPQVWPAPDPLLLYVVLAAATPLVVFVSATAICFMSITSQVYGFFGSVCMPLPYKSPFPVFVFGAAVCIQTYGRRYISKAAAQRLNRQYIGSKSSRGVDGSSVKVAGK